MERTESAVVQVAPNYENEKIQEMQGFGWSLQGRQEMRVEGDAYGRPSYLDSTTYLIKTKVSHYVKLHFIRSLSIANLERIRALEAEYNSLPFPSPASLKGPGCLTVFGVLAVLSGVLQFRTVGVFGLIVYGAILVAGILWFQSASKKSSAARDICAASAQRMQEIRLEVKPLLV